MTSVSGLLAYRGDRHHRHVWCTCRTMGTTLSNLFVDPTTLYGGVNCFQPDSTNTSIPLPCDHENRGYGFVQVLFLLLIYAYILSWSSNMISDGSELLLLLPEWKGIVGTVVLPVLGAVPDGCIVIFSGLGARKDVETQIAVGIGALAGSTIMLLTIPWFISVLAGRVDLALDGQPVYRKPEGAGSGWKRLNHTGYSSLLITGVACTKKIKETSYIMIGTALTYILIQGPAFKYIHEYGEPSINDDDIAKHVKYFALVGFVMCLIFFIGYLWYQVKYADVDDAAEEALKKALENKIVTLSGVFAEQLRRRASLSETSGLLDPQCAKFREFLRGFYHQYDVNKDGRIDITELRDLFSDLNENISRDELKELMASMDQDRSGYIEFDEFADAMIAYVKREAAGTRQQHIHSINDHEAIPIQRQATVEDDDDQEDEEEEVPEDLKDLSFKAQQRAIKLRSAWMMALGTFIVLLFSDPMVDVLSDIGTRLDIPAFYIAFVLAPLASNASELIAAYNYAAKKTRKTITVSLSTLEGAAVMNNTFCLGIFLVLIYARDLPWSFSAETISIFLIQVLVAAYTWKSTHRLVDGFIILGFYPLSLALVALLENVAGLD
eukprot:m.173729 g.173729  ORF g.173729 m.173729 type:complete len:609 (-) comp53275_c1_seq1:41-1867(-)